MESHAPCGDENAPEVEAGVATEDVEDPDGELDCHPEGYGCEDSNQGPEIELAIFKWSIEENLPDSLVPWEGTGPVEGPVKVCESDIRDGNIVNSVSSRHGEFSLKELIVRY
jgi:hypothetical protein